MYTTYLVNLAAALVPLVVGAIWYNPMVLGKLWMNASGVTEEKIKSSNMALIFILTYVGSYFIAKSLGAIVIHQHGLHGMLAGTPDLNDPNSDLSKTVAKLLQDYGSNYRTFKHGAYHGFYTGLYFSSPIIGIITLFERRGIAYFAIHSAYWIICITLMAGIVCAFMPIGW